MSFIIIGTAEVDPLALKIDSNLSDLASAPTSRTNLGLGTMAEATATDYLAKADNLSGLASTATAQTNLGLGTMAVATATDYLAKAGNLSGLADAPTARTNLGLTSLATASFATNAQAQTGASTTLVMSPALSSYAKSSPSYFRLTAMTPQSSTSGVGAAGQITVNGFNSRCPTTALGYGIVSWINTFHSRGTSANVSVPFPWGKRFVAQFRYHARTLGTDANTVNRVNFGRESGTTTGDLSVRGVGIKQVASGVLQLMVHNGTTLTAVSSTFTPSTTVSTDIRIESDGSGNVTLYSDDVSIATTSAGPNSSGSAANYYITIESENLALITGTSNGQYVSEITVEFAI